MSGFEENMPRQIGPYRFVRLLGKGAMGAVYEVVHEHLGVHLALKLFRTGGCNADFLRKRFLAEGKLLARLDHPRLVRVHDLSFDETDGTPYFTMDLVTSPDSIGISACLCIPSIVILFFISSPPKIRIKSSSSERKKRLAPGSP